MAFTKTIVVAVAVVAVLAQMSAAACSCGCRGGDDEGSYEQERSVPDEGAYSGGDAGYTDSTDCGRPVARAPWMSIPRHAVVTRTETSSADNCNYGEIRMPDEAPPAVAIVQQRPVCAQHLSYDIEVPAEQARPSFAPSYHSVNVEVPVRQRSSQGPLGPLPYSVEVPVQQDTSCAKLENLNVEIAVPVRQRKVDTRLHSSYTVEVPAERSAGSRLTNLKAQVDRIVLPSQQTCLPPNNGPVYTEAVTYVAVPQRGGSDCVSPVGLLGLNRQAPAGPASSRHSRYVEDVDSSENVGGETSSEERDGDDGEEGGTSAVKAGSWYREVGEGGDCERGGRAKREVGGDPATLKDGAEGAVQEKGTKTESGQPVGDGSGDEEVSQGSGSAEEEEDEDEEEDEEVEGVGVEAAEGVASKKLAEDSLEPELAGVADGDEADAGALNKRMCNSESMRRNRGGCSCGQRRGSSKVTSMVRVADDLPASRDCPTRFNLDTYEDRGDERRPQGSPCSCSSRRGSSARPRSPPGRDFNSYGSSCSVWRPSSSTSSSDLPRRRSPSGQRSRCSSYVIPENDVRSMIRNCDSTRSSPNRRTPQSSRIVNNSPSRDCRDGRILSCPEEPANDDYAEGYDERSGDYDGYDDYDDYEDYEGEERSLPRRGCECPDRRMGHHDSARAIQRNHQRSSAAMDPGTVLVPCQGDVLPMNRRVSTRCSACEEEMDESPRDLPGCQCERRRTRPTSSRQCDSRRDLPTSTCQCGAARDLPNSSCQCGATRDLATTSRQCDTPRDLPTSTCQCGAPRDLPTSSCQCGAPRDLPTTTGQCGAPRDLPTSSCQCGAPRDLPTTTGQCGAPRDLPTSSCQCGAPRDLPTSTCQCGAPRDLPTTTGQCGAPRDLPTSSCQCGAPRDLPTSSCQCGVPRDLPTTTGQCGAPRDLPTSPCQCGAPRDLPTSPCQCGAPRDLPTNTCQCGAARDLAPRTCQSPTFTCPICGKGLHEEHVDHIFKCIQEQRERAKQAAPGPSHAIIIPLDMGRSLPAPTPAPTCDPPAVGPACVRDWIEQINRALSTSTGMCTTCGSTAGSCGCCVRGQRSLKPGDMPDADTSPDSDSDSGSGQGDGKSG